MKAYDPVLQLWKTVHIFEIVRGNMVFNPKHRYLYAFNTSSI